MSAKNAIEKLHKLVREKETQKLQHKHKEQVEGKMLKEQKEEVFRIRENVGVLNIQLLVH